MIPVMYAGHRATSLARIKHHKLKYDKEGPDFNEEACCEEEEEPEEEQDEEE